MVMIYHLNDLLRWFIRAENKQAAIKPAINLTGDLNKFDKPFGWLLELQIITQNLSVLQGRLYPPISKVKENFAWINKIETMLLIKT